MVCGSHAGSTGVLSDIESWSTADYARAIDALASARAGLIVACQQAAPPQRLGTFLAALQRIAVCQRPPTNLTNEQRNLVKSGPQELDETCLGVRVIGLHQLHRRLAGGAGAQASEIHMLLRRAALRFGTNLEHVQGITTSATLAQGSQDAQRAQLEEYGARMFGKARSVVHAVVAEPYLPEVPQPVVSRAPLCVPDNSPAAVVPASVRTLEFDDDGRVRALVRDRAGADQLAHAAIALGIATTAQLEAIATADRDVPARVLYTLLAQSAPVRQLREHIASSRLSTLSSVDDLAEHLFGSRADLARRATDSVLRLGALARRSPTEHPLLPTRMHAPIRSLAVRALDSGSAPFLLVAPTLAPDAFTRQTDSHGRDGLLRGALALELRTPGSIRLLLGELPSPDQGESVAVASGLADLIEAGAAVRVAGDATVFSKPSRLLYTRGRTRRVLGAVRRHGGSWQPTQVCFGTDWGVGDITVELRGDEAELEYEHYSRAWDSARPVDPTSLRPRVSSGLQYVEVPHGATDAIFTSLSHMLSHVLGGDLGTIKAVFCRDRYLARSAIATWNLFRTLQAFEYGPRATVRVECLTPSGFDTRSVKEVLAAHPRDPLSQAEMKTFAKALQTERGVKTTFDFAPEGGQVRIPHGRFMDSEFATGGRLESLRISMDMGMDWIYSSNSKRWAEGMLMAKATHFVFIENYRAHGPSTATPQKSGRLRK